MAGLRIRQELMCTASDACTGNHACVGGGVHTVPAAGGLPERTRERLPEQLKQARPQVSITWAYLATQVERDVLPPVHRPLPHGRGLPQVAVVVGARQLGDREAEDAQALAHCAPTSAQSGAWPAGCGVPARGQQPAALLATLRGRHHACA